MMRTGVSYMGQHNPKHLRVDLHDLAALGCDDVIVAMQENDFTHFTGKLTFTPTLAQEVGIRPIALFWGLLNLFGGGRSSQFLLEYPEGRQVGLDGAPGAAGCYMNPRCVARIQEMIDLIAAKGFAGYFIDEPTPIACYCPDCRQRYEEWYDGNLATAPADRVQVFRERCVIEYIRVITEYCKARHPQLETFCAVMPCDRAMWRAAASLPALDNLGTDIYWVNDDRDVEEMTPLVRELHTLCAGTGKRHHEWLQAWAVRAGHEPRIAAQGDILLREQPDALYVWAYEGQIGTDEACDNPAAAWAYARQILQRAKG